ncbi:hypothetical protein PNOK_0567500 [Pyrrhoderma noxium]|uniref:RanBD1 domain-containing protein n=1 Tax=Pyrrhoderma noxium TaxID=2282107 RepID=A0A286UGU2_9AGAM|nr:hypothetical protein PNOK_0567500 [Pyrrhoderma noxium]
MKRGAEKQITRDTLEDNEVEEVDPSVGFHRADTTVLASRPMKGLPKRLGGANNATPSTNTPGTEQATTKPTFKGFGTASPSPFTFNVTPSTPTTPTPAPQPTASSFKFNAASIAPSASSASKQLTNILETPQANGSSAHTSKPPVQDSHERETKYFTSLRGLNMSFMNEVKNAVESDCFIDLGSLFTQYNLFRQGIQNEFSTEQKAKPETSINGSTNPFFSNTKSASTQEIKTFDPAPEASTKPINPLSGGFKPDLSAISSSSQPFGGASKPASSPASSAPLGGGFKPTLGTTPTTPSPFGGGFKPTFGEASAPTPKSAFGAASADKPAASSSLFSGSGSNSDTKSNSFDFVKTASKPSPFASASSTPSPFGILASTSSKPISVFGSTSSTLFGSKPTAETSSSSSAAADSVFGSKTSTATATTTTNAGSSSSPFVFGSKGNLGNPVGFVFGGSGSAKSAATDASTSSKLAFTFGAPKSTDSTSSPAPTSAPFGSSAATSSAITQGESSETSRPETPTSGDGGGSAPEDAQGSALGENANDKEGEGEQDEETVHTSKVKIYRFGKKDGQPHWAEVGIGMLRIKKHKTTGAKRLLSRNSANGRIMMNFKLYSGFKVTRTKQVLNFVGHDEGVNTTYRVRVKDEAGAVELLEAIEKAIAEL